VDLPPRGPSPGDEFITADDVVDGSGKTIGHTNGSCVLTSVVHGYYQCTQTVYLRNGSVELVIGARGGASVFTLAVVGGTGQWAGARGEATLQALDPNANRSTLTLRLIG
jgi:allene oxide cyclase-like protein